MIINTRTNVKYLPLPNTVEAVISNKLAPAELTATAFVLPIKDGQLVMANNTRRGLEIPGGHVEVGETLIQTAEREAFEEAGCTFVRLIPLGYLRNRTEGAKPEGYKYPYPLSYQQFFVGEVAEIVEYVDNDECSAPQTVHADQLAEIVDPYVVAFYREAIKLV